MKIFWLILTVAIMIWYGFVSLRVAIRGFSDIKQMLGKIENEDNGDPN